MAVTLPLVGSNPNYRVRIPIDDIGFFFDVRWNTRDEAWYVNLLNEDEDILANGIKIVIGVPLFERNRFVEEIPKGVFLVVDTSGQELDAGFDDLGTRVQVVYLSTDELAELS